MHDETKNKLMTKARKTWKTSSGTTCCTRTLWFCCELQKLQTLHKQSRKALLLLFKWNLITQNYFPISHSCYVKQASATLQTSERKAVRGWTDCCWYYEIASQQRRKEFMLIENYLIIFTITFDQDLKKGSKQASEVKIEPLKLH